MTQNRQKTFALSKPLRVIVTITLLGSLSACAWNKDRSAKIGGAVGGIVGGIMGAKMGKGSGKTAAIIIGATLGAMWGEDVARGMTDVDKIFASRTTTDTLEYGKPGETNSWSNPDTGHSGHVKADENYNNDKGENCRNFETTSESEGEDRITKGTACRMSDGEWRVQEEPA